MSKYEVRNMVKKAWIKIEPNPKCNTTKRKLK